MSIRCVNLDDHVDHESDMNTRVPREGERLNDGPQHQLYSSTIATQILNVARGCARDGRSLCIVSKDYRREFMSEEHTGAASLLLGLCFLG